MGEFIAQMTLALEKKDIHPKMSPEQKDLKKKALISIITGLGKKLDINPEVKLTRVVGLEDLTMYTPSFNKEAKEHRKVNLQENNNIETLGNKLVTREVENQRTFGVDMRHTIPFFRENEFKRMQKATMALEDLKNV